MTSMTLESSDPLRLGLNEIDRLRRRFRWMIRFLLACSIAFWCAAEAVLLLKGNVALGVVFALDAVMAAVFAVGINVGGIGYGNTLKVLDAIQNLAREQSAQKPAE
jgi:hypothetical protein